MNLRLPKRTRQPGVLVALVVGGRAETDDYLVHDTLDRVEALTDAAQLKLVVAQGGTPGIARFARTWAWHNGRNLVTGHCDWQLGAEVGIRRCQRLLDRCPPDLCLVFLPGGRGTLHMMKRCQADGVLVLQYGEGATDGGR